MWGSLKHEINQIRWNNWKVSLWNDGCMLNNVILRMKQTLRHLKEVWECTVCVHIILGTIEVNCIYFSLFYTIFFPLHLNPRTTDGFLHVNIFIKAFCTLFKGTVHPKRTMLLFTHPHPHAVPNLYVIIIIIFFLFYFILFDRLLKNHYATLPIQ